VGVNISAKADYGMRALLELTGSYAVNPMAWLKGDAIATTQDIPMKFLEGILRQLRMSGIVASHRGAEGGYRLGRAPESITVADVIRALDGPLAAVRGQRPEDIEYHGTSENLQQVWVAVRGALRGVLESVTLADLASDHIPDGVKSLLSQPGAWERR